MGMAVGTEGHWHGYVYVIDSVERASLFGPSDIPTLIGPVCVAQSLQVGF